MANLCTFGMPPTDLPLMTFKLQPLMLAASIALLLTACDSRDASAPSVSAPAAPAAPVSAPAVPAAPAAAPITPAAPAAASALPDQWLGKWTGPEGTYLQLAGSDAKVDVTISNLDGPRTFQGAVEGNQIVFERDGVKEAIHATNGEATGMKWLTDKTNCLTVRAGEGYCRD